MLPPKVNRTYKTRTGWTMELTAQTKLFQSYIGALRGRPSYLPRSLSELLHQYPGRESQIPRDRIYSLLSIASNVESFPINYGSSEGTVLSETLEHFERSRSMCLCSWLHIVNALECGSGSGSIDCNAGDLPVVRLLVSSCIQNDASVHSTERRNASQCVYCSRRPDTNLVPEKHVYCTKQICNKVDPNHFCLIPVSELESPGFRWIKNPDLEVHNFTREVLLDEGNNAVIREESKKLDEIQLTTQILMQFIRSSTIAKGKGKVRDIYRVPLELCDETRTGQTSSLFRTQAREDLQQTSGSHEWVIVQIPGAPQPFPFAPWAPPGGSQNVGKPTPANSRFLE